MNVHIVTDNPVYIDHFIQKVQSTSNSLNFFIYIGEKEIQNIKSEKVLRYSIKELNLFIQNNDVSKIFIHFLDDFAIDFLNSYNIDIPIYWFFWGSDGYRHPLLKKTIYLSQTKKILSDLAPRRGIKKILDKYRDYSLAKKMDIALSKIDFCCNQVVGDFNLIKSTSPNLKMQHKWFSYNSVEQLELDSTTIDSKNKGLTILLGNSANPSNNHLEAMEILYEFKNEIEKIYCPLSYSGSDQYIKSIEKKGVDKFGNKFVALKQFLAPSEYHSILDQIDVGFFYHVRQQAFSNSLNLLQRNKKIMMNKNSTLYDMFISEDIKNVYSDFGELVESNIDFKNVKLNQFIGEEKVNNWYKALLD